MTRFRAVVFDYGGCLTVPYREVITAFLQRRPDIDLGVLRDVLAPAAGSTDGSLIARSERGEVPLDELVAHLDGLHAGTGDLLRPETTPLAELDLHAGMARLHQDARFAGLRTGVLSNIFSGLETLYRLDRDAWDAVVVSCAVGMRKPEPEIYRYVCELLEVTPKETLYLDDFAEMCAGARAIGMTAIQVRDHADAVAEARRLLQLAA